LLFATKLSKSHTLTEVGGFPLAVILNGIFSSLIFIIVSMYHSCDGTNDALYGTFLPTPAALSLPFMNLSIFCFHACSCELYTNSILGLNHSDFKDLYRLIAFCPSESVLSNTSFALLMSHKYHFLDTYHFHTPEAPHSIIISSHGFNLLFAKSVTYFCKSELHSCVNDAGIPHCSHRYFLKPSVSITKASHNLFFGSDM
jgi:hypothetical protein